MKDKLLSFFSLSAIKRLYHTVKYLKWQQVFYRFYYPLKRFCYFYISKNGSKNVVAKLDYDLAFQVYSNDRDLFLPEKNTFIFLNKSCSFGASIDWQIKKRGLLWAFHLHYFDWLNDDKLTVESRLDTIVQYIDKQNRSYLFTHSFPASLRIVNWIKFLINNKVYKAEIIASIQRQSNRLYHFPEFEIMGNHLLQNGIALVWAGIFLNQKKITHRGIKMLRKQLEEQVLSDGVHFEKSFAYQSILVKNLMDLMAFLTKHNKYYFLLNEIKIKVNLLLSTLSVLVDDEGYYPNVGDSNKIMSICFNELKSMAQNLSLDLEDICLGESGFRILSQRSDYQLLFNSGIIKANYQPGHAHADAFSFTLKVKGRPIIVDRGVSTYENNEIRKLEKSTLAHNTVCINTTNSADLWSSFRMAKRPSIFCLSNDCKVIDYKHDGYYDEYKIWHRRRIHEIGNRIEIVDFLYGWKGQDAQLVYHFHPDLIVEKKGNGIRVGNINLFFTNCFFIIEDYLSCEGFNQTKTAKRVVCSFKADTLLTQIEIV